MYGIGQPLHAYDADLFKQVVGKWQFLIRNARVGETVSLLAEGGKNEDRIVELKGTELLIVDGATDTPIGLAGVKGGRYAGVHAGTKNIIIEAAHFNPTTTRKTARGLGIVIDASKRFENEPSRELPPYAQAEIIKLISNIAGGTFEGWADEYRQTKVNPEVVVPVAQVNALLGLSLASTDMEVILKRIGAAIVASSENSFTVVGPWERTDLNLPEDFIEEIGRIHGLSNIVSVHPNQTALPAPNVKQFCTEAVRQELLQNGFSEVITSSFTKSDVIQLQNSLASDKSYLRSKLRKNIYKVLDSNFSHIDFLGIPDVRVFEIGTVFDKTDTSVSEHPSVALGVRTKGDGYNPKDDAILKTACETVEQVLDAKLEWQVEKGVAEANLSTVLSGYEFPEPSNEMIFTHSNVTNQFKAYSNYPAMSRDIALWVQEGELAYDVEETIGHAAGDLCVRLSLFDTFTKDGRTSYAFRIVFQSFERTLTDIEINDQMERAYSVTKEKGWEVR